MKKILNTRDMNFLLYEFLNTRLLLNRLRYAGHSEEIFNAMLCASRAVAEKYFANHYSKGDAHEPTFDGKHVQHIRETKEAWDAIVELGIINAQQNFDNGGMQLPYTICAAANAYLSAANIATSSFHRLTIATANLIRRYGSEQQKQMFLPSLINGSCSGTLALTEADQGFALGEIKATAYARPDGSFRIKGQQILIANGEHNLTNNIVHLVLARAQNSLNDISLYIVPKLLVNVDGSLGQSNEVVLERLLAKMGCRNATSTRLNFGSNEGAKAYLIGKPNRGLHYISQMMSASHIDIGIGAAALAYQGYLYSLTYARKHTHDELSADKSSTAVKNNIIEHAEAKRMLLLQKVYAEGGMALGLYAASLMEDGMTADTECERQRAAVLLNLLAPVIKSWPAKYGCISNDLAIQILAGSGYSREVPIEQLYRDQRVNPIQQGAEAIHGIDLLNSKIPMQNEYGFDIFKQEVRITLQRVNLTVSLHSLYTPVDTALELLGNVTHSLLHKIKKDPNRGLANTAVYLDMFGRITMAWVWLRQALAATRALESAEKDIPMTELNFYQGKIQAARFYIEWELPQAVQQANLLTENNQLCFDMKNHFF